MASKENFFQAHWDWLVAGGAFIVLAGVVVFFSGDFGTQPDDAAAACETTLAGVRPAHDGVAPLDDTVFRAALQGVEKPPRLADVDGKQANFLASERRITCMGEGLDAAKACGRPIPPSATTCPFCGVKQPALVKVEIDSDHDGLPNDWEVKYGFNPNSGVDAAQDADKDGFTNLEEFTAQTDPKDAKSHPDYLDSLVVDGALKQTNLPFFLREANQIPDGKGGQTWRATFVRLNAKKYEDKTISVKIGEPIKTGKIDTGWALVSLSKKSVEVAVKGGGGMKTRKDVYEAEIKRTKDARKLVVHDGEKKVGVEAQATLVYRRGVEKRFDVAVGTEFELNGSKYRVVNLKSVEKRCEVTVIDMTSKKQKTILGT